MLSLPDNVVAAGYIVVAEAVGCIVAAAEQAQVLS